MREWSRYLAGVAVMAGAFTSTLVWSQTRPAATAAATTLSATAPSSEPSSLPIAVINGKDINNAAFYNLLMQVAGIRVFQNVLDVTLVTDGAEKAGVKISPDELKQGVQDEWDRMADAAAAGQPGGTTLKPAEKNQILFAALQQRGLTMPEVQLMLTRQAILRKWSVVGNLTPTQEEMHAQYLNDFDEKMTAHVIALGADNAEATKAAASLVEACGLRTVADRFKPVDVGVLNKALGELGLQWQSWNINKSADEKLIGSIKKAAYGTPLGTLSAVTPWEQPGGKTLMVLVYPDQHKPSELSMNREDDPAVVRRVTAEVTAAKQAAWMNDQLNNLRAHAQVEINDKVLLQYYEELAKQRAAATAAAPPGAPSAPVSASQPNVPALPTGLPPVPAPVAPPPATRALPALPGLGPLDTTRPR